MNDVDKLVKEVEANEKMLKNTKEEVADAIMKIYTSYIFSIDKQLRTFFGRRRRVGKFIIKSKWIGVNEYNDGYPLIKVYYRKRLILKVSGRENGNANTWKDAKFRLRHVYKLDMSKIVELQTFHNILITLTQEQLHIKNEKINKLNNFQLALKELEV